MEHSNAPPLQHTDAACTPTYLPCALTRLQLLNLIAQLNATITRGAIGPIDPDLLILDPEPGPGE
jgi:hypothetical protein